MGLDLFYHNLQCYTEVQHAACPQCPWIFMSTGMFTFALLHLALSEVLHTEVKTPLLHTIRKLCRCFRITTCTVCKGIQVNDMTSYSPSMFFIESRTCFSSTVIMYLTSTTLAYIHLTHTCLHPTCLLLVTVLRSQTYPWRSPNSMSSI